MHLRLLMHCHDASDEGPVQTGPFLVSLASSLAVDMPHTVQVLQSLDYNDFVFTVCDNAAGETCPVWPGQPMTAHWGVPDPAEAKGSPAEIALAFKDTYRMLRQRIGVFAALPIRSLDRLSLQRRLKEIGNVDDATANAEDPI
jgi:arsenate reductase (thioredoxin)